MTDLPHHWDELVPLDTVVRAVAVLFFGRPEHRPRPVTASDSNYVHDEVSACDIRVVNGTQRCEVVGMEASYKLFHWFAPDEDEHVLREEESGLLLPSDTLSLEQRKTLTMDSC